MSDTPGAMGTPGSHDAMRAAIAKRPAGKILDAPSGQGAMTAFLLERGWDVHCADIDPGHLKLMGKVPFEKVNLNRDLPYADGSFDAVVCANALQRLYNPGGAIREFARILLPGGHLYINVNNYASIDRRLRFLFCGSIMTAMNEGEVDQTISDPEARVRMLLMYPQLANLLAAGGFEIRDMQRSAVTPVHRLLAPIAWLIRLVSLLVPGGRRRRDHIGVANGTVILPGGDYLFIDAVKVGATPASPGSGKGDAGVAPTDSRGAEAARA